MPLKGSDTHHMGNVKTQKRNAQRRRNAEKIGIGGGSNWKTRAWAKQLRERIRQGLEHCRECKKIASDLTFDHLIPASQGGRGNLDNITILCERCQKLKGDSLWPHLKSLREEGFIFVRKPTPRPNDLPYRHLTPPFDPQKLRHDMGIDKPEPLTQKITPTPKIVDFTVAQRMDKLEHQVTMQKTLIDNLLGDLNHAFDRIKALEDQGGTKAPAVDPLNEKILAVLQEFPGLKLNTGSIAANIESTSVKISGRLNTMASRGLIKSEKLEGKSTMYWVEKPVETVEEV